MKFRSVVLDLQTSAGIGLFAALEIRPARACGAGRCCVSGPSMGVKLCASRFSLWTQSSSSLRGPCPKCRQSLYDGLAALAP